MSNSCRILSRKGNTLEIESMFEEDGIRAVARGTVEVKKYKNEWEYLTDTLKFDKPEIFFDPKEVTRSMEREFDCLFCSLDFKLPGEFERVEAKEAGGAA